VNRLLDVYSASLRIFPRRPDVFLGCVLTLHHYFIVFGYDAQNLAGGAFVVAGYDFNHITFFNVQRH
jgi:hypothetical protein